MFRIKPPSLSKIWRFSVNYFLGEEFSQQTIYDTIIVKNKEGANMGYDAYVYNKKKYTKLCIEKYSISIEAIVDKHGIMR